MKKHMKKYRYEIIGITCGLFLLILALLFIPKEVIHRGHLEISMLCTIPFMIAMLIKPDEKPEE
jgi:hypothetical protein